MNEQDMLRLKNKRFTKALLILDEMDDNELKIIKKYILDELKDRKRITLK